MASRLLSLQLSLSLLLIIIIIFYHQCIIIIIIIIIIIALLITINFFLVVLATGYYQDTVPKLLNTKNLVLSVNMTFNDFSTNIRNSLPTVT